MRHHIRAVLFDLDGVVVDTTAYHYRAWKRLADENGWKLEPHLAETLAGVPRAECLQTILELNGVEVPDDQRASLASRKNAYFVEALCDITRADVRPGVIGFVEDLRARNVKCGLYSLSSSASIVAERLALGPLFDAIVTGSDRRYADWNVSLFEDCARKLRVPTFHCIVLESTGRGVRAALSARMKVVGIGATAQNAGAREMINDFSDVNIDFLLDSGRAKKFPEEPWNVTETHPRPGRARYWETLFALTNGFMGLRGSCEEEDPVVDGHAYPGTFVNGVYGYKPYHHVVEFPGFPKSLHVMLNLADWRIINLWVNGERFGLYSGTVSDYRRSLDMRRGVVERSLVWQSPGGRRVKLRSTRLVSMAHRHNAAIRYEVTALDRPVSIMLESKVRTSVASEELGAGQVQVISSSREGETLSVHARPVTASTDVGMAFAHRLCAPGALRDGGWQAGEAGVFVRLFEVELQPGTTVTLDKHAAFCTSIETSAVEVVERASREVARGLRDRFEGLVAEQERFWAGYWEVADVVIDGSPADQQALRFSLFHLRQSNPEDDRRSIGANGMTGDKYRGHVFWDTEMYLVPHFLYTEPWTVRSLLMYRYSILDRARERAREMGGVGALYAWNSISGEECGVVFEAATAEYHLLCAIAYAIWRYTEATGDTEFLFDYGAEILFETSRFLENRGAYVPYKGGTFCINAVCGPDEYGCAVNNNCYTNVMTQWHLRYAAAVYERMSREKPDALSWVASRIELSKEEPARWKHAADSMYIPYNAALGIHEQDDSFLSLDPVDMSMVPRNTDIRELVHPLNLWRMQAAKQADVVLLMFVQGHQFALDVKKRNYEFYEPRTCHGSSLSACMHSIVAAETGAEDDAYDYFRESVMMDLSDFKDNTGGGMHAACLGGTWMAVVNGFGGMRDYPDGLRFAPMVPATWKSYAFTVLYKGVRIRVEVAPGAATYRLLDGDRVTFAASGKEITLSSSDQREVTVKK